MLEVTTLSGIQRGCPMNLHLLGCFRLLGSCLRGRGASQSVWEWWKLSNSSWLKTSCPWTQLLYSGPYPSQSTRYWRRPPLLQESNRRHLIIYSTLGWPDLKQGVCFLYGIPTLDPEWRARHWKTGASLHLRSAWLCNQQTSWVRNVWDCSYTCSALLNHSFTWGESEECHGQSHGWWPSTHSNGVRPVAERCMEFPAKDSAQMCCCLWQ